MLGQMCYQVTLMNMVFVPFTFLLEMIISPYFFPILMFAYTLSGLYKTTSVPVETYILNYLNT